MSMTTKQLTEAGFEPLTHPYTEYEGEMFWRARLQLEKGGIPYELSDEDGGVVIYTKPKNKTFFHETNAN